MDPQRIDTKIQKVSSKLGDKDCLGYADLLIQNLEGADPKARKTPPP